MRAPAALAVIALLGSLAACSGDDNEPAASSPSSAPTGGASTGGPTQAPADPVDVTVAGTVATGLNVPWGIAFLPDRTALVAERDTAKVKRISGSTVTEVGTIEGVDGSSEGGLLGLAVDRDFANHPNVYAYYSSNQNDNRIARLIWNGDRLTDQQVILTGIPMSPIHNGGRLAFGPDGFLYAGTGDGSESDNSQNPNSLGGKILRITRDGKPAPGNPNPSSPVYTLGHRNVQGLAFDDKGRLYAAEFGQNEWDELNYITPGSNYGWPAAEGIAQMDGFTDPIAQWHTDEASPSGIAFAQGTIFMASLRGARLWAIPVADGRRTGEPQAFFTGEFGRLRTVVTAPDGSLWLSTSNTDGRGDIRDGDDRILRLTISH
jgi:glucose/arabinose dehydrogenase